VHVGNKIGFVISSSKTPVTFIPHLATPQDVY